MKKFLLILSITGALAFSLASHASADVPTTINYRGWLDGYPASQVTETLIFRLYDSPTSSAPLKELAQTVDIYDGNFSVLLGFSPGDFQSSIRYIGVFKADGVTELTNPRPRIVSVPYAYQAGNLYSTTDGKVGIGTTNPQEALDVVGRIQASQGISAGNLHATSGGNVGIGTTTPQEALDVVGTIRTSQGISFNGVLQTTAATGDDNSLDAADGSPTDVVYVNNAGNVGVGTTAPAAKLDVVGLIRTSQGINFNGTIQSAAAFGDGHSLDAADGSPVNVVYVNGSGNVGVGTTSPSAKLHVDGSEVVSGNTEITGLLGVGTPPSADNTLFLKRGGTSGTALRDKWAAHIMNRSLASDEHGLAVTCFGMSGQIALMIGRSSGSTSHSPAFWVDAFGNAWLNLDLSVRSLEQRSDARLKENVEELSNPLKKVLALRGVSFEWKDDGVPGGTETAERNLGFIGQEVEKVVPEAVTVDQDGYYCVSYSGIVPVLVEAMQEQQSIIDSQKSEIDEMRDELKALKELVSRYNQQLESWNRH